MSEALIFAHVIIASHTGNLDFEAISPLAMAHSPKGKLLRAEDRDSDPKYTSTIVPGDEMAKSRMINVFQVEK